MSISATKIRNIARLDACSIIDIIALMYLADVTIKKYLHEGKIEISPKIKDEDIRPIGIRLHLAKKILIPTPGHVDLLQPVDLNYSEVNLEEEDFVLEPNGFILGSTVEKIRMAPDIMGFLDGRSTIARLGLTVHVTAGVIDGKHDVAGTITLEIKNLGVHSVRLRENDAIGQLIFATLGEDIQQQSQSQYIGQDGVVAPNLAFRPGIDT